MFKVKMVCCRIIPCTDDVRDFDIYSEHLGDIPEVLAIESGHFGDIPDAVAQIIKREPLGCIENNGASCNFPR